MQNRYADAVNLSMHWERFGQMLGIFLCIFQAVNILLLPPLYVCHIRPRGSSSGPLIREDQSDCDTRQKLKILKQSTGTCAPLHPINNEYIGEIEWPTYKADFFSPL